MKNHYPIIDIGANLSNKRFRKDLDQVLLRAKEQAVKHIVVTGTSIAASQAAYQLTEQNLDYLSSTAGVHPHDAKTWSTEVKQRIQNLVKKNSVVAVGECGLDFNRDFSPRPDQERCFEEQLALAVEIGKPVFLHERDAHERFVAILSKYRPQLKGAVVHCFTGNRTALNSYLKLDCHIGITGWVCDERRGSELQELVKEIPLNRLMIETDAPYLTPRNMPKKPKQSRNESCYLPYVLKTIADLRKMEMAELAKHTYQTSQEFFGI